METIDQIKIDEGGYRAEIYLCSSGKLTWLYGRNITDRPINVFEFDLLEICLREGQSQKDWADILFRNEIQDNFRLLKDSYGLKFQNIEESASNVIYNMAYNMGVTKFNPDKWPKFFKAIQEEDYKQAAKEGRDSKWFNQVGQRSIRLMNSLEVL